ncbi:MAG: hypothetical protein NVS3B3_22150 [Aquirhabdus sp.]
MESLVGSKDMMSNKKINNTSIISHVSSSTVKALMLVGCLASSPFVYADALDASATQPAAKDVPSKGVLSSAGSAMDSTLDYFGLNHTRVDGLHQVYVGIGDTNSLLHFYADAPTRFGHVYAKVGQFFDGKDIAGQVGFRMPYNYDNAKNNDGLYFGAYAGHIENSSVGKEHKDRLGAAIEMSYLFLNKTSLTAASVSIGGAQAEKTGNADQKKVTPIIMFGVSWGYGMF